MTAAVLVMTAGWLFAATAGITLLLALPMEEIE